MHWLVRWQARRNPPPRNRRATSRRGSSSSNYERTAGSSGYSSSDVLPPPANWGREKEIIYFAGGITTVSIQWITPLLHTTSVLITLASLIQTPPSLAFTAR